MDDQRDNSLREPDAGFSVRLRRAREAAGLAQEELAERAGLSPNAISALERGEHRHPYPATVRALADALELSDAQRAELIASVPKRRERTGSRSVSRLPVALSELIGRADETAAVTAMLRRPTVRIVTLTGLGGVGKTRLAMEVAAQLEPELTDGVWFVSLAAIVDPSLVAAAVANALGVRDSSERSPAEALAASIQHKQLLLVLDNFEQLLPAAAFVSDLVRSCPKLNVLLTSRALLRITGEHDYPVQPLTPPGASATTAQLAANAAVRLFALRASAVDPTFELSEQNGATIAAICERVDGLPLAIELAAARTRLIPPELLLPKLEHRLPLLSSGPRDVPARLRTMRDAIAWSYELLSPGGQEMFRILSAFNGGFSLSAAECVAGERGHQPEAVLEQIELLAEHSLVRRVGSGDGDVRLEMLETIREFGVEQLVQRGEEHATRDAHSACLLGLAEMAANELNGSEQLRWFTRLDADLPNMRAAISWLHSRGRSREALRIAVALGWYWYRRNRDREGLHWITELLSEAIEVPDEMRIRALVLAGDSSVRAGAHLEARTLQEQALSLARGISDDHGIALALRGLGNAETGLNEFDRAEAHFQESYRLFAGRGAIWDSAVVLQWFGILAYARDDYAGAATNFEAAQRLYEESGDKSFANWMLGNVGWVSLISNDFRRAGACFEESLAVAWEMGDDWWVAWCLMGVGGLAAQQHDQERAARLFGAATAVRETAGAPLRPSVQAKYELLVESSREAIDLAIWKEQFEEGQALALREAVSQAREFLEGRAR